MRIKRMIIAVTACMAFSAFAASAAQANWIVGTSELSVGASETVNVAKTVGSTLTFSSKVLGTPVTLEAAGVECGTAGGCKIESTATDHNHSSGTLKFTGVTVTTPLHCEVKSKGGTIGTVTTSPLQDSVVMGGTNAYDTFAPATGEVFVEIEFAGTECTLPKATAVPVKGTTVGKAANATGVTEKTQTLTFSEAITKEFNTAAGKTDGLTLGKEPAVLTGSVTNTLASEAVFGANEN